MSEETTELTPFNDAGLPANVNLGQALGEVISEAGVRSNEPFLLCTKGKWNYKSEDEKVQTDPHSQWVVNASSIKRGFICWGPMGSGKVLGERMASLGQPAINEGDLPAKEFEGQPCAWDAARSFLVKAISGEDEGEQLLFKTNAIGGVNAVNDFMQDIFAHYQEDPTTPHPIVLLRSSTFDSDYGVQHKPEFKILGWCALDGDEPPAAIPMKPVKKKAKKKTAAPAPVAEVEDDEDDDDGVEVVKTTPAVKRRKRV